MARGSKSPATEDASIRKAAGQLQIRAERTEDLEHLVATFVDCGIIDRVDNGKNQILYGRRGTGKTHVLRFLESTYREEGYAVAYVDARTLGSSTIFSDLDRPLHDRFLGLYRDVLGLLHNALFEYLVANQSGDVDGAIDALSEIERQLAYSEHQATNVRTRESGVLTNEVSQGLKANLGGGAPAIEGSLGGSKTSVREDEIETQAVPSEKIVFPPVYDAFSKVIERLDAKGFLILLDEWSSIPIDLQPFLAELLNRVFFANPRVTIKIATLEFRSRFVVLDEKGHRLVGLELGGDIETAVDLDDFYVFDRDPAGTERLFADLLYKHLNAAFDDPGYLETEYGVTTPDELTSLLFTDQAFKELVRAAEGVARDFLQIFARAFTNAWRAKAAHITVPIVTSTARDWYESDKQVNLDEAQHKLLRALIETVIRDKRARSFLVSREDSASRVLRFLIDQRVVHIIRRGYADKDNPGIRYNIYTLDYGCYVDLKATKGEPEFEVAESDEAGVIVPFDDNRRIRRIIVPSELLA